MAKKWLLLTLFWAFFNPFGTLFATNALFSPPMLHLFETCNAPAPDNFHVTNIGAGLVDLEWQPVWQDALHTLQVFQESSTGGWNILASYFYVPGSTFSVPGLTAGSYKVSIATVCTDTGETGVDTSELKIKIVDLTTGGRIPLNPVPVDECSNIDYLNHKWVGFRVKEKATGISNLFEYQEEGLTALIRRVYNNPIVAVDNDGFFPIGNQRINVAFSFRIDDKSKPLSDINVGYVKYTSSTPNNPTIGLCIDPNGPISWKSSYEFTALIAENIQTSNPPAGGSGQGFTKSGNQDGLIAQNPFSEYLNIFRTENTNCKLEFEIQLIDMNGKMLMSQQFDCHSDEITFQTDRIAPGPYLLIAKSKSQTQRLRVIKH